MAQVKFHKFVAALPAELEANAIYYVRAGAGFDIYVTNSSGTVVAYPLNVGGAGQGFFRTEPIAATATGQTVFTVPGGYTPGAVIVSLNGATLPPADYTATDGATVVLASGDGIVAGSVLLVYVLSTFEVADALPLNGTAKDSERFAGLLPPPEDGKQYALKDGAWVEVEASGGGSGLPLLTPGWVIHRNNIGDGYAAQDGQLLSRATYPDAWAQAQAIGMVITDAEWLADPLKRGFFSDGDGSTTFRLPDANGKQAGSLGAVFLRGDGALSTGQAGLIQRDALQGHKHTFNDAAYGGTGGAAGTGSNEPTTRTRDYNVGEVISDSNYGDARVASETRALNLTVVWTIKLFGAVVNVGSADAAQLASDYANLAAALQTLDGQIDFTIIYPNGGSEASPANVVNNMRYIEGNPFPGHFVICEAEVLLGGQWGNPGIYNPSATNADGVKAVQLNGGAIIVQTGSRYVSYSRSNTSFDPFGRTTDSANASLPCRVKVWKCKGVTA